MTSASLSLSNRISNHKKYITRTLWTSIIGFLIMAVYYFLGTIVMVSRSINYGRIYHQTPEYMHHEMVCAVTRVLGFEQLGWVLVVGVAIAFAFQGFSYLFEQKKIDFYLSQPTTRADRIRKNYFNAITTFLMMYAVIYIVSLLIAACMGAMSSVLLVTALIEYLRMFVLFFTMYNITVLAILLCGSFPIAMLVLVFFMIISAVFGLILIDYKGVFYATYAGRDGDSIIASPLYDKFDSMRTLTNFARQNWFNTSIESIKDSLRAVMYQDLDILVVGLVAFAFVIIFSRFRKAEHAGKAIVYRPFRWLLKIVICIICGLGCGYIFYAMNDYVWNNGPTFYALMFAIMILSTILVGCILESILEGSIRYFIKGKAQTIMAVAIVALTFVIFKGDLLGYDSYIPSKDKVESCAFLSSDSHFQINNGDDYRFLDDTPEEYMYITDVDSFSQITKLGMANQKKYIEYDRSGDYRDLGMNETVLFRLKNGREVYRQICIPYDIDEKLMSSIINSDEFKEGYFTIFHDEEFREFDAYHEKTRTVYYNSGLIGEYSSEVPYSELSDAYRKDIKEHFTYEMARANKPVGQIDYDNNFYSGYASCSFNVYGNYENTIAVLKKYGIYSESTIDVDKVESVEVTNFYPGFDIENMSDEELQEMYMTTSESKSYIYTDRDEIKVIIENAVCTDFYSKWYTFNDEVNGQFSVMISVPSDNGSEESYKGYYSFRMGKVPDFVYSDTNN